MDYLKWGFGAQDKDWFTLNGEPISNNKFNITKTGVHTLYYQTPNNDKRVYTFNVTKDMLPSSPVQYGFRIDESVISSKDGVVYLHDNKDMQPAVFSATPFMSSSKMVSNPWADKFPFNQIKPCVVKGGAVQYYLNPDNFRQKEDKVTFANITGADGDVMIEIPKVYWSVKKTGSIVDISISNEKIDNTFSAMAHTRNGKEFNKLYVSAFRATKGEANNNGKLLSVADTPFAKILTGTPVNMRNIAKATHPDYKLMTNYTMELIQILFILMYKDRISQNPQGKGWVNGGTITNWIPGDLAKYGMYFGTSAVTNHMKFLGIEDLWGTREYLVDGLFVGESGELKYLNDNTNFDINPNTWTSTGVSYPTSTAFSGATAQITGINGAAFVTTSKMNQNNVEATSTTMYGEEQNMSTLYKDDQVMSNGQGYTSKESAGLHSFKTQQAQPSIPYLHTFITYLTD